MSFVEYATNHLFKIKDSDTQIEKIAKQYYLSKLEEDDKQFDNYLNYRHTIHVLFNK